LLDLPNESKLHLVFHISVLKQHMGTIDPTEIELPDVLDSQVQPQAVFGANGAQGVPRNLCTLNIIFSSRSFVEKNG